MKSQVSQQNRHQHGMLKESKSQNAAPLFPAKTRDFSFKFYHVNFTSVLVQILYEVQRRVCHQELRLPVFDQL